MRRNGALLVAVLAVAMGCGARSGLEVLGGPGAPPTSSAPATSVTGPSGTTVPGGSDSGEAALCDDGGTVCGNDCVDKRTDARNCGACENVCSGATPVCMDGTCTARSTSCAPGGPGLTDCGTSRDNCCTSLRVEGGVFYRTYDKGPEEGPNVIPPADVLAADGGPTGEADPATVSSFQLDKYEVTVGRFRQFVAAWNGGWRASPGSGKHTHINGGLGLAIGGSPGSYEPGWVASDDARVAPASANLDCYPHYATWAESVGSNDNLPINCANWYEAYAFCIW
ncbi:MAG TPA: SUMF1/EgtB/PvdO family nonheme iron enzyme, partial [Polyangiaceae bacterium]|nr:SUMF1/EgtB/PvdO family nonheme iron enzyme [Polyangiaceae bacterium]